VSIEASIQQLVYQVQDDEHNIRFKPGFACWLADLVSYQGLSSLGWSICEIKLGYRKATLKKCPAGCGSCLRGYLLVTSDHARLEVFNFVTIELVNTYSDYGCECESPAIDSS
jgi:hypothetical protein